MARLTLLGRGMGSISISRLKRRKRRDITESSWDRRAPNSWLTRRICSEICGPLGDWSGITPDGSPLFVRDVSTDEIYALDLELP